MTAKKKTSKNNIINEKVTKSLSRFITLSVLFVAVLCEYYGGKRKKNNKISFLVLKIN